MIGCLQAHLSVEAINAEGLRGVTATVDVKEGESIALLPTDLIIEMGSERHSSAENAAVLLGRLQKELQWHKGMMPYWTSLPEGNGSIFCRHLFTKQEIALLQSDSMAEEIQGDQEHLHEVYNGRAKWWEHVLGMVPKTNLPRELGPEHNVTLEAFAHTACLVGAYAFACQRGRWPFHYKAVCLLPLMDMLNHRSDGQSNAVVDQNENGTYSCYAKRDIKAGEEVTQTYSPVTARSDHSLLQYGFVEEFEEPLLAAVDSATGFDMEDDTWYGMHQQLIGPEESKRLKGILERLQGSQDEDSNLLEGKPAPSL
ncbi:g10220 [Coccomyxa viridis]|uniref:G10220 protein n=1 Tax=Coccomyxa viridis TaxID=1274662 RepID=A0ABP1G671_9CHLO